MGTILVVDDEPSVLAAFGQTLKELGHDVLVAPEGETALRQLDAHDPDLVVADLCMPGVDGLELFRRVRQSRPHLPVIIMTGQGTMESAIEATKLGAFDYQLKPLDPEVMVAAVERAIQAGRSMRRSVELSADSSGTAPLAHDAVIGRSPAMQEVFKAIGRVAATDATVLIRGESGTGKELVARALYQHSRRAQEPLLIVNCAAIPEALLESELFGHERGAFTGALVRRVGKFEQAQGGTIFLDEIGDISLSVQVKILRVLQERTIERIGGQGPLRTDVRVLAATNRDLEAAIGNGSFREDLFYRLNVVSIHLPPLRERPGDIGALTQYFLRRTAHDLGTDPPVLTSEALAALEAHSWPGNVRELEHTLYRAMIFTHGYPIQAADVQRALAGAVRGPHARDASQAESLRQLVAQFLDEAAGDQPHSALLEAVDRQLVCEAMERARGNQTYAARLLGLTRPTLHAKLRRYGWRTRDEG